MPKIGELGEALVAELKRRALEKDADIHRLLDEFKESSGAGARIITSDGDGEVRVLIPIADGYDGPEKLQVAPFDNTSKILDEVPQNDEVVIHGVRFAEFILSPLAYKKAFGADGDKRPKLALRGQGPDGAAGALGFDSWFWEDLLLVTDLAHRGGVEVRPDVEVDPRDPSWKKLSDEERAFIESRLGRRVPGVVHRTLIADALAAGANDDGAVNGALKSLSLAIGNGDAAPAVDTDKLTAESLAAARPVLVKLFGEELFTPRALPAKLAELAEKVLIADGNAAAAKVIVQKRRGDAVDEAEVEKAIAAAFGAEVYTKGKPTLDLIDKIIDLEGPALAFSDAEALRRYREDLDYALEADLFGADIANRPLSTASADAKLSELYDFLRKDTGLDDERVYQLAARLGAALNAPSSRPAVIVLAGKGASSVDTLYERARKLAGSTPIDVQGASDLRLTDPVGFLVGSPSDQPGVSRGILVRDAPKAGKFVACMNGLEALGAAATDPEERKTARLAFWNFLTQVQRDGWFRGYDPNDPNRAMGAKIELKGGVIILRTTESLAELREGMSAEAWAALSAHVIDFARTSNQSVLAELREGLRQYLIQEYGFGDAQVELSESMQAFLLELLSAGMDARQLSDMVRAQVLPRLFYSYVDGSLGQKIRVDMVRGLTPREQRALREAWLKGESYAMKGLGGCPFALYDEGRFEASATGAPSTAVSKKLDADRELDRLRRVIAHLSLAAKADQDKIKDIINENLKWAARTGAAEKRIDELKWLNERAVWEIEDLKRLNELANKAIVELRADLEKANQRIDALNADIAAAKKAGAKMKEELKTAVAERDQIQSTLRSVENEFMSSVRAFGNAQANVDPLATFNMIIEQAQSPRGRYHRAMLEQALAVAAGRALESARAFRDNRTNKFEEIARLAAAYTAAAHALGVNPNPQVLQGMETAARLSGYGWNNNMAAEWERLVGEASRYQGRDPSFVGNAARNILRRMGIAVNNPR